MARKITRPKTSSPVIEGVIDEDQTTLFPAPEVVKSKEDAVAALKLLLSDKQYKFAKSSNQIEWNDLFERLDAICFSYWRKHERRFNFIDTKNTIKCLERIKVSAENLLKELKNPLNLSAKAVIKEDYRRIRDDLNPDLEAIKRELRRLGSSEHSRHYTMNSIIHGLTPIARELPPELQHLEISLQYVIEACDFQIERANEFVAEHYEVSRRPKNIHVTYVVGALVGLWTSTFGVKFNMTLRTPPEDRQSFVSEGPVFVEAMAKAIDANISFVEVETTLKAYRVGGEGRRNAPRKG